ncbi:4Fe-4S single cluster domain-containing protein [Amycolatopsis sp. NBC_01286]|uniref:4Fe-4S single cluster domain-containing protein n=1 Tax=Amycolatopsis sp. NBC_01286 TaxID=2903560 RepID=UPI002E153B97|nr:radical SAM protein [Amycolatopsis sp. NBC_01286]
MLRVNRVHHPVTALGPGTRLGIWLQGCPLACPGCMSRDTWDPNGGTDVPIAELVALWRRAVAAGADGLTVSGGEPLEQAEPLARFLDEARAVGGDQEPDFLLYTGFELDELDVTRRAVLARADAVVTGRYQVALPTGLLWRGSANQQLIPLTDLGRDRYAAYTDFVVDHPPIQIAVDDERLFVIGVPPPGALPRLERALRDQGIAFREVAWRR